MTDVTTKVQAPHVAATSDWHRAVKRINRLGSVAVMDVCVVLGDPVGGVFGAARPEMEKTYRNAIAI